MRPYLSLTALCLGVVAAAPLSAQVTPPPGWAWHHDQRGTSPDSSGWAFTSMAPGFHLTTTTTGATLFPTGVTIEGRRAAEELLGAWQAAEAVVRPDSNGYSTNVLRMDVGSDEVVFSANGKRIGTMPRSLLPARAGIAFRMGAALKMHVTTFDLITPMAPVPVPVPVKRTP